jgi:serine/threonine-protein kinase HipA
MINVCPACFKPNESTFCKKCRFELFDGKKISHILPFSKPFYDEIKFSTKNKISISGVQTKHSLKIEGDKLFMTEKEGEFILKPIPNGVFLNLSAVPANEHLTMQIAKKVFKINTAKNAIVFFSDGTPAYLVKRFDRLPNGFKILQEDFAQISNRSAKINGENYKYDFSYEEIAELIKKHVAAYKIDLEQFFEVVIFNYLIGNGDAHLKNFSLFREPKFNEYRLTPAYDLLNTNLHITNELDTALELFKDGYETEGYKFNGKFTKDDFSEFGSKIGIKESRVEKIISNFGSKTNEIENLIKLSFLNDELKVHYFEIVKEKLKRLNYSFSNDIV